jgi:SOS response regulatory protein OraA/RecX
MSKTSSRAQIIKEVAALVTVLTRLEGDSYLNDDIMATEYTAIRLIRDVARLAQQLFEEGD